MLDICHLSANGELSGSRWLISSLSPSGSWSVVETITRTLSKPAAGRCISLAPLNLGVSSKTALPFESGCFWFRNSVRV